MASYLKQSLLSLIALAAVFGLVVVLTNAGAVLNAIDLKFFILACIFYIGSIVIWLISWAFLIKKHSKIPYPKLLSVGIAALYGALTPVQLGAEALRSIRLKDYFAVTYSDSVSASMIAKGIKFSILAIVFVIVFFLYLLNTKLGLLLTAGLFSGFVIIVIAACLFLMPLQKKIGMRISKFFSVISKTFRQFAALGKFFADYSNYLQGIKPASFAIVFALSFLSLFFEFLALQFAFLSLGIYLQLPAVIVLMILVSILERTPFLPRGIGIVEIFSYAYLSVHSLVSPYITLTAAQIGAVLIVYDIARLVVPTIAGIAMSFALYAMHRNGKLHKLKK